MIGSAREDFFRYRPVSRLRGIGMGLVLLLLALLLSGCDMAQEKTAPLRGDWSRAWRVGNTMRGDSPALAAFSSQPYLFWVDKSTVTPDDEIRVMDVRAEKTLVLPTFLAHPRQLAALAEPTEGADAGIHLFVLADAGQGSGVYHMRVNQQGELSDAPVLVTPDGQDVGGYVAARGAAGELGLLWTNADTSQTSVFALTLDAQGRPNGEPQILASEGHEPAIVADGQDGYHVIWTTEPEYKSRIIWYARLNAHGQMVDSASVVTEFSGGTGTVLSAPALGHDDSHVYIFWSIEYRGGMQQGEAVSYYVAFPADQPRKSLPKPIRVPEAGEQSYISLEEAGQQLHDQGSPPLQEVGAALQGYGYQKLTPLSPDGSDDASGFVVEPTPLSTSANELPVLMGVMTSFMTKSDVQPGMAVFMDGILVGYQVVGHTPAMTVVLSLAADVHPSLYSAWLGNTGESAYEVFFATTDPTLRAQVDQLSPRDILLSVMSVLWGILSGIAYAPLFLMALILPFMWLGIYHIFGHNDTLQERGPRWALAIAALCYAANKAIMLAPMLEFPPFRQVIPLPLLPVVQVALPLVVLLLAVGVVLIALRRTPTLSLLRSFLVLVGVDILLTLLLYGPGIFV